VSELHNYKIEKSHMNEYLAVVFEPDGVIVNERGIAVDILHLQHILYIPGDFRRGRL
jgi:hypothetical protein